MKTYSELLDMQTRGESVLPNPHNKVTKKRKALGNGIMNEANGNSATAFAISMNTLENHIPRLQEFVLSHGEEPAADLNDLVKQVYQLRMTDVSEAGEVLDFDTEQGITHMEQQENDFEGDFGYVRDEFLGELFAPIEIAYTHLKNNKPDGFVDPAMISGIVNTVGGKLNSAEFMRAAQGKPANFITGLSTGGKRHYQGLLDYFKKNPDVAKQVMNGQITDEASLPNWTVATSTGNGSKNPIKAITDNVVNDQFKRAIPYIIGFLLLIGVIVYLASRHKK